jgi:hypothetical protein
MLDRLWVKAHQFIRTIILDVTQALPGRKRARGMHTPISRYLKHRVGIKLKGFLSSPASQGPGGLPRGPPPPFRGVPPMELLLQAPTPTMRLTPGREISLRLLLQGHEIHDEHLLEGRKSLHVFLMSGAKALTH